MFMTKRELDRRIAEGVATARANEASRSILPYWNAVNESGLSPEADQRAAALRAAKDVLGDVLTEDLLDAADFIHDGTRYGVDDDDDDAPVHDEAQDYYERLFADHERELTLKAAERTQQFQPGWQQAFKQAKQYAGSDDRLHRATPDTAPLIKLSPEAAERLEKLREASRVSWGTTFGSAEPVTVPGMAGDSVTIERLDDDEPDERGSTDGQTHG
jgi:hypothetical protein